MIKAYKILSMKVVVSIMIAAVSMWGPEIGEVEKGHMEILYEQ